MPEVNLTCDMCDDDGAEAIIPEFALCKACIALVDFDDDETEH